MIYRTLIIPVFGVVLGLSSIALAQDKPTNAPLFITPYQATVPTYTNNVPNMVRPPRAINRSARTYTSPNRVSKPMYDNGVQFPADFGRITGEQDFFDKQTGRYYGQYDYFALLASRGDTAKLQQVVGEVQRKGVFDPAKYQAAMGGADSSSATSGGQARPNIQRRVIVKKNAPTTTRQNQVVTPQRVHQGYDDTPIEDEQPAQPRPKNAPIFLR